MAWAKAQSKGTPSECVSSVIAQLSGRETELQRRERPALCSRKEQGWNAAAAWPLTLQPGAVNVVALLQGKSTGNYEARDCLCEGDNVYRWRLMTACSLYGEQYRM